MIFNKKRCTKYVESSKGIKTINGRRRRKVMKNLFYTSTTPVAFSWGRNVTSNMLTTEYVLFSKSVTTLSCQVIIISVWHTSIHKLWSNNKIPKENITSRRIEILNNGLEFSFYVWIIHIHNGSFFASK